MIDTAELSGSILRTSSTVAGKPKPRSAPRMLSRFMVSVAGKLKFNSELIGCGRDPLFAEGPSGNFGVNCTSSTAVAGKLKLNSELIGCGRDPLFAEGPSGSFGGGNCASSTGVRSSGFFASDRSGQVKTRMTLPYSVFSCRRILYFASNLVL